MEQQLIENALELCGKTMEDMNILPILCKFSIQNFCYYLLSPEFIEKYYPIYYKYCLEEYFMSEPPSRYDTVGAVGNAIHEYQRRDEEFPEGNEKPLIELLSNIKTYDSK